MKNIFPRWLIVLLTAVVAVFLVWFFKNIIIYFLVAGVLSLLTRPVFKLLLKIHIKRWRMKRWLASLISMLTLFLVIGGLFAIFIPLMTDQARIIANIDYTEVSKSLEQPVEKLDSFVIKYNLLGEDSTTRQPLSFTEYLDMKITQLMSFTTISSIAGSVVGVTGSFLVGLGAVMFILFFFLKEEDMFSNIILSVTPEKYERQMANAYRRIVNLLTRYFGGVFIQILSVSTVIPIGLWIVGVPNALLIGVLSGVFNIIPYVGPVLGAMLGLSLSLAVNLDANMMGPELGWLMLQVFSVFVVAQLLDNFVFQPFIFSSSVKAHPLEIFAAILAGSTLAGIPGMILAVPVYTVIRVMAQEFFSEFRVVRRLTGSSKGGNPKGTAPT